MLAKPASELIDPSRQATPHVINKPMEGLEGMEESQEIHALQEPLIYKQIRALLP